jgi:hypothetical protein
MGRAMRWIPISDDRLPTWAHTAIILTIVSVFGIPPIAFGLSAIQSERMPRIENWDGDHWFGGRTLDGDAAIVAGLSLVCLGLTFLTMGFAYIRPLEKYRVLRPVPWLFLALFGVLYLWTVFL